MTYGRAPEMIAPMPGLDLREVMYYLYLPVVMFDVPPLVPGRSYLRIPDNVMCLKTFIQRCVVAEDYAGRGPYKYVYLSARKGWATRDNPLNRPGWHCDGFGTDDMNYVWWKGPGTRFATGYMGNVPDDHVKSLDHFQKYAEYVTTTTIVTPSEGHIYRLDPYVVHATPLIETPCWRQYVKVSFSNHRYNLENNSHNYLFDYDWPLMPREDVRNDTHKAQRDYA